MLFEVTPDTVRRRQQLVRQVLGGHVEELIEAWTFQRKFGNVQRSNTTSEDTEQPPAFQNFIPGRRHNQAGHRYIPCILPVSSMTALVLWCTVTPNPCKQGVVLLIGTMAGPVVPACLPAAG